MILSCYSTMKYHITTSNMYNSSFFEKVKYSIYLIMIRSFLGIVFLTIVTSILIYISDSPYVNTINYFENHGWAWLQLVLWFLFPRLSFIFLSAMTGGFFFWLGVLIFPRIMVAYWATFYYWDTNPILCLIAWLLALGIEPFEKYKTSKIIVSRR